MSQIGWRDPVDGRERPFGDWLVDAEAYGEALGFPYEILKGIHSGLTKDRPDGLSVTMLLGCPRAITLEKLTDYYTDPADDYPAFRGTLVHGLLEKNASSSAVVERRFYRYHRGVELSGQLDRVALTGGTRADLERWLDWCDEAAACEEQGLHLPPAPVLPSGSRFQIDDYKSKHLLPQYTYVYEHHQQQGNLYRWMLRLPPDRVDINFIYVSMEGVRVMPLYNGGTFKNGRAKPQQIWDDAKVEEFLDERMAPLTAAMKRGKPVAYDKVPDDDLWQCRYCPVMADCYRLAAEEAHRAWDAGTDVLRVPPRTPEKRKK